MLILTRKEGESIMLNHDIKIKVLATKGGQVKIGVEAPLSTSVWREELYEKINHNKNFIKDQAREGAL